MLASKNAAPEIRKVHFTFTCVEIVGVDVLTSCVLQGSEKPGFFLKKPNLGGLLGGLIGFYWVLGFIGFFGDA